ncbi:LOW QUALITY PROTEIN: hypothetical protein Cgig2_016325 [Carnegiea gigantea]|uniref:Uncharacterized protein n=1 Tax=Carnegiea gigantea TaxID=171969 RepID=A0A9Q1JQZ6_9CARY|nr:LOW QUALITY PROTEIN: hypothetical protein Cgig2_016325 [Carnegiea gigantea]
MAPVVVKRHQMRMVTNMISDQITNALFPYEIWKSMFPSSPKSSELHGSKRIGSEKGRLNTLEMRNVVVLMVQENCFNATLLEKVNSKRGSDEKYPVTWNFYQAFAKLLKNKRNWGVDFQFHGCVTYEPGIMEWTAHILIEFEGTLKQAGIFGVVGEIGISLYDIERISGLSVIGDVYEEFLPRNDLLCDPTKYPPTVAELLCIHAELCHFHKCDYVFCNWWLDHFYRGELSLVAREYEVELPKLKKNNPSQFSSRPCIATLNVTRERELATFITFCLSRFVLPHGRDVIRLETFMMAASLAKGQRLSLAFSLGTSTKVWGKRRVILVIRVKKEEFFLFIIYTHVNLSLSQARHIFRDEQFAYLQASTFPEDSRTGRDLIDVGLLDDDFRTLRSLIDIYKLSTIGMCWLSSKIEEIFGIIEESVDIDLVNALSDRDLTCSSKLNNLSNEASKLRVRDLEGRAAHPQNQHMLIEAEGKLKSTLDLKKKEADQDLEKEKDHLKNLIRSVISFKDV